MINWPKKCSTLTNFGAIASIFSTKIEKNKQTRNTILHKYFTNLPFLSLEGLIFKLIRVVRVTRAPGIKYVPGNSCGQATKTREQVSPSQEEYQKLSRTGLQSTKTGL